MINQITGEYEVNEKGHLDIPLSIFSNIIELEATRLPFEFDKNRTIIFFPVKFNENDLKTYRQMIVFRNRKLLRYSIRKNILRLFFNRSPHLSQYYPYKTKVCLVRRSSKEIGEDQGIFVALKFSEQLIPKKTRIKIKRSKWLFISKHLTEAMKENLSALGNYAIIPIHALKHMHKPQFRESPDILINFSPDFIKKIDVKKFKKYVKNVNDQTVKFRFSLRLERLSEFFSDRREIDVRLLLVNDTNILITKDLDLQLPDNTDLLDLEMFRGHKMGLKKFKTEFKKVIGAEMPIDADEIHFFDKILLEVSLVSTKQITSEIAHKIYWYYWILQKNLKNYAADHEILTIEQFYPYISKIFAIYNVIKYYYPHDRMIYN